MTGEKLTIYIGIAVLVILEAIYIFVQDSVVPVGPDITVIKQQADAYKKQNIQLHDQYLHLQSYQYIAARAKEMGFVPAEIVYLR